MLLNELREGNCIKCVVFRVIQDVVVLKFNLNFRSCLKSGEMFKLPSVTRTDSLSANKCKLWVVIKVPEKH